MGQISSTKPSAPAERRAEPRVPVEMWVEQATERELYFQRSANISAGGIYLEHTVPQPLGTRIRLRFLLPDDDEAVEVEGEIVNVGASGEELGMGVKFVAMTPEVRRRIDAYIERNAHRALP